MPQLIRRGGEQMASKGQGRVEFALSLEKALICKNWEDR